MDFLSSYSNSEDGTALCEPVLQISLCNLQSPPCSQLAKKDEEAAECEDRNYNNDPDRIEQVRNGKILIVCCHQDHSYFASEKGLPRQV
jgi:hypothetical protein